MLSGRVAPGAVPRAMADPAPLLGARPGRPPRKWAAASLLAGLLVLLAHAGGVLPATRTTPAVHATSGGAPANATSLAETRLSSGRLANLTCALFSVCSRVKDAVKAAVKAEVKEAEDDAETEAQRQAEKECKRRGLTCRDFPSGAGTVTAPPEPPRHAAHAGPRGRAQA